MSAEETGMREGREGAVRCREALERLSEFLDSELDEVDCDRIRVHLADCEGCLSEYDVEDHIKKLVKRSCRESAPPELHLRIHSRIIVAREGLL